MKCYENGASKQCLLVVLSVVPLVHQPCICLLGENQFLIHAFHALLSAPINTTPLTIDIKSVLANLSQTQEVVCKSNGTRGLQVPGNQQIYSVSDPTHIMPLQQRKDRGGVFANIWPMWQGCSVYCGTRDSKPVIYKWAIIPLGVLVYVMLYSGTLFLVAIPMTFVSRMVDYGTLYYVANNTLSMIWPTMLQNFLRGWIMRGNFAVTTVSNIMCIFNIAFVTGPVAMIYQYEAWDLLWVAVLINASCTFWLFCACPSQGWHSALFMVCARFVVGVPSDNGIVSTLFKRNGLQHHHTEFNTLITNLVTLSIGMAVVGDMLNFNRKRIAMMKCTNGGWVWIYTANAYQRIPWIILFFNLSASLVCFLWIEDYGVCTGSNGCTGWMCRRRDTGLQWLEYCFPPPKVVHKMDPTILEYVQVMKDGCTSVLLSFPEATLNAIGHFFPPPKQLEPHDKVWKLFK